MEFSFVSLRQSTKHFGIGISPVSYTHLDVYKRQVVGLLCLQRVKHQVHGVLELLVILPDLHRVAELDEGGEILFLHRGLLSLIHI